MASAIDIFVAYKFIKQLTTPWKKWDAYELGLIDVKGNTLKKRETKEEEKALPAWKILVKNLKRLLEKLPGGKSQLASFAVGLWLIKEEMGIEDIEPLETEFKNYINASPILIENVKIDKKINILEKGRYKHTASGDMIFLRQDAEAIGEILETPIFRVKDFLSEKEYTIKHDDITRV